MMEEGYLAIEMTQTVLWDHGGRWAAVATTRVSVLFAVKLDTLISYYERDLYYY